MTDQSESKVASRDVKRAVRLRSYSTGRRENQWKQKPSDKQSKNLWTFELVLDGPSHHLKTDK